MNTWECRGGDTEGAILPMNQINKPVLNYPVGPLPVYHLLTVCGFGAPSLLSVMTETHFIKICF